MGGNICGGDEGAVVAGITTGADVGLTGRSDWTPGL
jgi:hypothetical protein